MNQEITLPTGAMLLTLIAGAAVGAVVVALTTPKTGPQLRGELKHLVRQPKRNGREKVADCNPTWDQIRVG